MAVIYNGIEKYDRTEGPGCFDACPSHKHHPFRQRNTSDECWIYCCAPSIRQSPLPATVATRACTRTCTHTHAHSHACAHALRCSFRTPPPPPPTVRAVPCVADYSTLLGASRLLPSGALPGDTGMPTSRIFNLFEQPFKPMHEGGCPDVTPPAADIRADARARHGRTPTLRPWRLRQRIAASMYRQAALAEAAEAVDA